MKSHSLFHMGGLGGWARPHSPRRWNAPFPAGKPGHWEGARDPAESEAAWQKHVVVGLWICLALVIVLSCALLYAKAHGLLPLLPNRTPPLPPWPDGI